MAMLFPSLFVCRHEAACKAGLSYIFTELQLSGCPTLGGGRLLFPFRAGPDKKRLRPLTRRVSASSGAVSVVAGGFFRRQAFKDAMRTYLGIFFLTFGIPVLLIGIGSFFVPPHTEMGALMFGGPFTLLGLYCLLGPD
jgi:hypothetical protein